jgi:hypothetical protein
MTSTAIVEWNMLQTGLAPVGLAGLVAYFGFRLRRAASTQTEKYGSVEYPRESAPFYFWFFVSFDVALFLFVSIFLGLVIISTI